MALHVAVAARDALRRTLSARHPPKATHPRLWDADLGAARCRCGAPGEVYGARGWRCWWCFRGQR